MPNNALLLSILLVAAPPSVWASRAPPISLVLKNHRFTPAEITAPAGQEITIALRNEDGSAEEFDSNDLGLEEDVTPHGEVRFGLGPLKPGTYRFKGEAHAATAQGVLTVTP